MQWVIDGTVHLTSICQTARWKGKACLAALEAAGLTPADAQLYMLFAFGTDAEYKRSVHDECLSAAQYARLSITNSPHGTHPCCPNL